MPDPRDTGLNMGFRQLELNPTCSLLFSLTNSGWLVAWDWEACLNPTSPSYNLILWKTNTKHETPIIKFVVNNSRIVSVEKHQMTCEWDVRKFVVVRDFWQFQDKRKRKSIKNVNSKRSKK